MTGLLIIAAIGFVAFIVIRSIQQFKVGYNIGKNNSIADAVSKGEKPWGAPWSHVFGSAYFLTANQVKEKGIGIAHNNSTTEETKQKLLRSTLLGGMEQNNSVIFNITDKPGHILTIAPTRSGKGTGCVIPNLLHGYYHSMVVNDIKGENFAVTARFRKSIGQRVIKYAPFDEDTNLWNPLDMIGDHEDTWEDVRTFAELLIPTAHSNDPFWDNEARNFLSGLLLHVHDACKGEEKTLFHTRHLLTRDEEEFEVLISEMLLSKQPLVQRAANAFSGADDKVRSGILSTLNSHLSIWDSPRLKHMTSGNDFDLSKLREEPTTVYFSIPPGKLGTYAPVIRLFMGLLINTMTREQKKGEVPVLFMLDEFPALGRIKAIEDSISYLAGYGVNLWLFAQDLKQLVVAYGEKAQSIFANCHVKQFFGVSDYETAKLASQMCGDTTIPTISTSSDGTLTGTSNQTLNNNSRPLLTPEEVMTLPAHRQLLFYQNQKPVSCAKINYLEHSNFFIYNGEPFFDPNPYHN